LTLTYKGIYKNIDVKFYGNNKNLEHDIIVKPGGDPLLVKFAYKGIKGLNITGTGDLEVSLKEGMIIEQRPVIYQEIKGERVAVEGSYRLFKGEDNAYAYGFTVASYDTTKDLVIDPVLVYSTYLGGSGWDAGESIAVDASGNVYITGVTQSINFPLVLPFQANIGGGGVNDAFVTKINAAGTAIVYSSYLGGSVDDKGHAIAVDTAGNAYITGETSSADFPTVSPFQAAIAGVTDAFITKINPSGSGIIYSSYLGGINSDKSYGIAVDTTNNAYITGETFSADFPTMNPIQGVYGGVSDVFVSKINPNGSAIVYSTYLGGSSTESPDGGIAVDASGNAYISGGTWSLDFPLASPIQGSIAGSRDIFITEINPTGTAFVYSTYLGGSSVDSGFGLAVDASGSAYITGQTVSLDFPIVSSLQGSIAGADDAFVMKLAPSGTAIVYSTYLGGSAKDSGRSIAVDSTGSAYVTGVTESLDFPLVSPIQGLFGGGFNDAFVIKIDPSGSPLVYSTYLGANGDEVGSGIAVETSGSAFVTGETSSAFHFPLVSPIQGAYGGGFRDAFISKISGSAPPPLPVVTLTLVPDVVTVAQGSVLGYTLTATNTTASIQCFQYWENVNLPGGALYPANGSLLGYIPRICLDGGLSRSVHLTHGLPLFAPIGAYVFNVYDGIYPVSFRTVVDTDSFNFNVTAAVLAPGENLQNSWHLIENGFRK